MSPISVIAVTQQFLWETSRNQHIHEHMSRITVFGIMIQIGTVNYKHLHKQIVLHLKSDRTKMSEC